MNKNPEKGGEVVRLGVVRSERQLEKQIKGLLDKLNALPRADLTREDPVRAEILRDLESATTALTALKASKK